MQNAPPPSATPDLPWTRWITPHAAGTKLGLSTRTIRRMCRAGILTARNISAGRQARYLIDPNSLDKAARPVSDN